MQDVATLIYNTLKNDSSFIALMGGKTDKFMRIYNNPSCPNSNEFPRSNIIETLALDSDYADDEAYLSRYHIRIDFWHNINNLRKSMNRAKEVIEKMFDMVYVSFGSDMYESGTGIYHKQLEIDIKL